MDIKLIAMDLDGTALLSDHCSFSPKLISVLEAAHKKGIQIVPTTGRQLGMLPPVLKEEPDWENYVILCNGAQIRNMQTGELLHNLSIPGNTLKALLELAKEFHLPIEFSANSRLHLTKDSIEIQRKDPVIAFHVDTILPQYGILEDSLDYLCADGALPIEKVNIMCVPRELRPALEKRLEQLDVSAVWSSEISLEISHVDATKGNALKKLCQMLNISADCVMALGDAGNDISMLRLAGLGVAMGNAPDNVKNAADILTQSNVHDGAANAIERIL